MMKLSNEQKWLILIILIAFILRVVNNHPSFFCFGSDEAEYSLRAIYILQHNGTCSMSFLHDHPPLFMYSLASIFLLFGSEWYVARGFCVLLGLLITGISYLLGKELKNKAVGLIMAMLFAFSPVMVSISRQVFIENLLGLFMLVSFLLLLKFDKKNKWCFFLLSAIFLGMACNTKYTAFLMLPVFFVYTLKRRLYLQPAFLGVVALFGAMIIPSLFLIWKLGFAFHFYKTTVSTCFILGRSFNFGHFSAMIMSIFWLNITLIPVYLIVRDKCRYLKTNFKQKLKEENVVNLLIATWAVAVIFFFSIFSHIAPQYIHTISLPVLLIAGLGIYKYKHWLRVCIIVLLIISVFCMCNSFTGSNTAVEYMQQNANPNDTILTSDPFVFKYYFQHNTVYEANESNIMTKNATYLVLSTAEYDLLIRNDSVSGKIKTEYVRVYSTNLPPSSPMKVTVNFFVFKRCV